MKEYIKRRLNEYKEYVLFKKIPINIINDNINLNIKEITLHIESFLKSSKYFKNIEGIYVGDFSFLKDRQIHAMYNDNCIYISNTYNNTLSASKDIIHELAHSLENEFGLDLYGDSELEFEFFKKKKFVLRILKDIGYLIDKSFLDTNEYSYDFDLFLYKTVGYANLTPLIINQFISPYSLTSLSEYFANGFEVFFTGDKTSLQKMCPVLYSKIDLMCKLIKNTKNSR